MRPLFYYKYHLFYDSLLRQFVRTWKLWGGVYFKGRGGQKSLADNSGTAVIHQKLILKKEEAIAYGSGAARHPKVALASW